MSLLNLIHTKNLSIETQLKLEKHLLKNQDKNYCLINEGCNDAIVLGISNNKKEHVDLVKAKKNNIKIIRRFSGGGSVFVDKNSFFITFIFSKKELNFSFPEQIFKWTEAFYKEVFVLDSFALKENDFVISDKKCGGNAQYITKHRWLFHTSFLWDFSKKNMDYLLLPKKAPSYRNERDHGDFLCVLKDFFVSKKLLSYSLKEQLAKGFVLNEMMPTDFID